jgi:Rrf2 family protein
MRLQLTRRGDYAIRAVIALARHAPDVVGAAQLADEMAIPRRFVAQVMTEVVRSGIAEARLGRSGGYRLRRAPGDISVLDVVAAVEGDIGRRECVLRNAPCGLDGTCVVHEVFMAAQDSLLAELREATIASLLTPDKGSVATSPSAGSGAPAASAPQR